MANTKNTRATGKKASPKAPRGLTAAEKKTLGKILAIARAAKAYKNRAK